MLGIETFTAKIKFGNVASEKLFAKLGFVVESRSEVFEETTFQLKVEILQGVINNCVFSLEYYHFSDHCQIIYSVINEYPVHLRFDY